MVDVLLPRRGPWSSLRARSRWLVIGLTLLVVRFAPSGATAPAAPPRPSEPILVGALQAWTPQVERDLPDIEESGVLRVLLRRGRSGYHLIRGEERGFEYELARRFARDLGVRMQVVLPDPGSTLQTELNRGRADLVAVPFLDDGRLSDTVAYTLPYQSARSLLVTHRDHAGAFNTLEDLAHVQVAVRRWSSEERLLSELRSRGVPVGIVMLSPQLSTDDILELVADGVYKAAVARDHVAEATQTIRDELHLAFELAPERPLRWAVRGNSPELREAVDHFLIRHRVEQDTDIVRSEFYNVLSRKYFSDTEMIQSREEDPFLVARTGRLSPYDDLFQDVGAKYDLDWRLLASVSFQESRFDPEQESWAGAIGLMQVMPRTAGMTVAELLDPASNVEAGARHLKGLLELYSSVPREERLSFALAAYNCGQGHLDDARILTIQREEDPNRWSAVRESLILLSRPEYYTKARYGYVRASETVNYVDKVLRSLGAYRHHIRPASVASLPAIQLTSVDATE